MSGLRTLRCVCALALALAFSVGCSDDDGAAGDAAKAAVPKAARKAAPEEPAQVVEYHYDPTDKVDPFRSYVRRQVTFDPEGNASPLERFDLTQLAVMGIIWGLEEPRALVRDPTGKNKGRILRIEDNKVVVKETYLDHLDRATTKEVDLELYVNGRKG
jgi:Tfp pilus assembly protein PilP